MIKKIINGMKKVVAVCLVALLAFVGALALIPSTDVKTSSHYMTVSIDGEEGHQVGWTEVDSVSADWSFTALDAVKECIAWAAN